MTITIGDWIALIVGVIIGTLLGNLLLVPIQRWIERHYQSREG